MNEPKAGLEATVAALQATVVALTTRLQELEARFPEDQVAAAFGTYRARIRAEEQRAKERT